MVWICATVGGTVAPTTRATNVADAVKQYRQTNDPARHSALLNELSQVVETARSATVAPANSSAALDAIADLMADDAAPRLETVLLDSKLPLDLRRQAARLLAKSAAGSAKLLELQRGGRMPREVRDEAMFALLYFGDAKARSAANATFAVPKTASGQALDFAAIGAMVGNPRRGERVYFLDRNVACSRCHRIQGRGKWVGPDLSDVGARFTTRGLLWHIVNPSSQVDAKYLHSLLALDNGRVLSGLVISEDDKNIVFTIRQGERMVIPLAMIESRKTEALSIMPEDHVKHLTEQDLADLVAYLARQRQKVYSVSVMRVLGPLPPGAYRPKGRPDFKERIAGSDGKMVGWQLRRAGLDDYLDLSDLLRNRVEVAGHSSFCSDMAQAARLVVSSTAPIVVYCNGESCAVVDKHRSGPSVVWEATLKVKPGDNELLLICRGDNLTRGLLLTLIPVQPIRWTTGE